MLPQVPDELTPSTTVDILTVESDSITSSFNLSETVPSLVVQPDLSFLDYSRNFQGNHWYRHSPAGLDSDSQEYQYINLNGTRYYKYSDGSSVYCDPRDGGLVRYESPSGEIEKEVKGKGSILLVMRRSDHGLVLHLYSPLPMGKSQNVIYREYASESNLNL